MKDQNGLPIDRSIKTEINGIKVVAHYELERYPLKRDDGSFSTRTTANEVVDGYELANGRWAYVVNGKFDRYK